MGAKKKKKDPTTYRKLKVGSIKGQVKKLSRMLVEREIPLDGEIIFNSVMSIAEQAACYGYEQRVVERRLFKEKKQARINEEWELTLTQIDDIVNEKK